MFDDDSEFKRKEHALGEDPALLIWKRRLERGSVTPEKYAKAVDRIYRKRMKAIGLDPDLDELAFPLPSKRRWQENPEILLGHALNGIEVGLSLEELCRGGIIVVGKPGSGKTTFLIHLAKQLMDL